ncbi:MAG TPA: hypothetical protein V6D19_25705 [Stenomitos sp.]
MVPLALFTNIGIAFVAPQVPAVSVQALPPGGCAPGWKPATYPLNPQLGCLPTRVQLDTGARTDGGGNSSSGQLMIPNGGLAQPTGQCKPGWSTVTYPLNVQLRCLPRQMQAAPGQQP